MSVREHFVATFGESAAAAIEKAGFGHRDKRDDSLKDRGLGSDPFKCALVFVIGYGCVSRFAEDHGISIEPAAFKSWVREHGELASHDGDMDYISVFTGAYNDYVNQES